MIRVAPQRCGSSAARPLGTDLALIDLACIALPRAALASGHRPPAVRGDSPHRQPSRGIRVDPPGSATQCARIWGEAIRSPRPHPSEPGRGQQSSPRRTERNSQAALPGSVTDVASQQELSDLRSTGRHRRETSSTSGSAIASRPAREHSVGCVHCRRARLHLHDPTRFGATRRLGATAHAIPLIGRSNRSFDLARFDGRARRGRAVMTCLHRPRHRTRRVGSLLADPARSHGRASTRSAARMDCSIRRRTTGSPLDRAYLAPVTVTGRYPRHRTVSGSYPVRTSRTISEAAGSGRWLTCRGMRSGLCGAEPRVRLSCEPTTCMTHDEPVHGTHGWLGSNASESQTRSAYRYATRRFGSC
jgi:hypothetical protein